MALFFNHGLDASSRIILAFVFVFVLLLTGGGLNQYHRKIFRMISAITLVIMIIIGYFTFNSMNAMLGIGTVMLAGVSYAGIYVLFILIQIIKHIKLKYMSNKANAHGKI